ncbi:MAG: CHAT domain-containing protein [Acidobacteria bacterium]|nr:CHAT domain-containing protein [Acidobacteriota bacterium]
MSRLSPPRWTRWARGPGLKASVLAPVALAAALCYRPAEPLEDVPTTVRGHQEVVLLPDGSLEALFLGEGATAGLCAEVPATTDTSRWQVELTFDGRPSADGYQASTQRMGTTVCFDGHWPDAGVIADGEVELCARGVDRFDDRRFRWPCQRVRRRVDATDHRALEARLEALFSRTGESVDGWLPQLDELAAAAHRRGFPLFEVRLELIAVHFLTLEGRPQDLADARRRLEALPTWLDLPEASARGAQAAYQRGIFALDAEGHLDEAWTQLAAAERRYRRIADADHFLATVQQAAILSQLGVSDEAVDRLGHAIDECASFPCDRDLLAHAEGELAWLILLDPYAGGEELTRAGGYLAAGLETLDSARYPLEVANQLVNLAYLETRQGRSPEEALARAEALLPAGDSSEGATRLRDWARLVRGLAALDGERAERAAELCGPLGARDDPQLSAWAWSCLGRAQRLLGRRAAAARSFEQALLRHEHGRDQEIGQRLPLGPGQRGDDFAQAARLAVDMSMPEKAWALLARLDRIAASESERRRCREQATDPETRQEWRAVADESRALLRQLAALDAPAAGRRAQEVETVGRELKEELRQLWRSWPGCRATPVEDDAGLLYRAVAVDDEVLLLHRAAGGRVRLEKRTPVALGQLVERIQRVTAALEARDLDDDAWSRLTESLAGALVPARPSSLPEVTTFALQGLLQEVPLAALPLPDGGGPGRRFLGEVTAVALFGAGARPAGARPEEGAEPLFVVDPRGDLAGASRLADSYRQLFPEARILRGAEATRAAFREALPAASWLHVDAHGLYEAAFPELSAIQLADRPLALVEVSEMPLALRFANLSGCQTGRWPTTADSGRYGLAGLLSRLGVAWIVGSRFDLDDAVAADFNRSFYQDLRSGLEVPAAYRDALSRIGQRHPASSWAGLILLAAGEPAAGGQSQGAEDS